MNTRDKNNNNDNKKSNESAIRIKSVTCSDHRSVSATLASHVCEMASLLKFGFISFDVRHLCHKRTHCRTQSSWCCQTQPIVYRKIDSKSAAVCGGVRVEAGNEAKQWICWQCFFYYVNTFREHVSCAAIYAYFIDVLSTMPIITRSFLPLSRSLVRFVNSKTQIKEI